MSDEIYIRGTPQIVYKMEKLKKENDVLRESLKHIAEKNYEVSEQGLNYNTRFVCSELFSGVPLNDWASNILEQADKIKSES